MNFVYTALIFFVASAVQGAIGFGAGPVVLAFLPLMVGYSKAIAINTFVMIWATIFLSVKCRKNIPWKILLPILIPSVIIAGLAAYFSISVSSDLMMIMLGFVLIVLAIWFLIFAEKIKIKPNVINGSVMGVLTGLMSGLFAIGGPTAALYLLPATDDKDQYFASIQVLFALCNTVTLTVRICCGLLAFDDINYLAVGLVSVLVGSIAGRKVFRKLDKSIFEKLVYLYIGINGLWIIISRLF